MGRGSKIDDFEMDDPYRISVSEVFSEKFNKKKSGNRLKFHAIMPINLQHSVHAISFFAQCSAELVLWSITLCILEI